MNLSLKGSDGEIARIYSQLSGSAKSESGIAIRDFMRTMPAANIATISDRRAGTDNDDGKSDENNIHRLRNVAITGVSATDIRSHNCCVCL